MSARKLPNGYVLPVWLRPGVPVWYSPHVGSHPRYLGMIAGEPRELGGTVVVRLERMEHGYRKASVAAACVAALEPVWTIEP